MTRLLTPAEVADRLATDESTVLTMLKARSLKGMELPGGQWRVAPATLESFIASDEPLRQSPYMITKEAAKYCRCQPKTLLNHHSLGNVKSLPKSRPLLFRQEELDKWIATRPRRRKK